MSDVIFKTKVDDVLAKKVKDIIRQGSFRDEDAFLREAIKEMVRMHELRELGKRMDRYARKAAREIPLSFSEAVLAARERKIMVYRPRVCLDSSVAVKWFRIEENSKVAFELRGLAEAKRIKLVFSAIVLTESASAEIATALGGR